MKITKTQTETYILSNLDSLDPVTVYVTNYEPGKGKIVIECFGSAWANYWGGMSNQNLQDFFIGCNNAYILEKLLNGKTNETDFDEIEKKAKKEGFEICANSDVELAMQANQMCECFGNEWFMDLPTRVTSDYRYLSKIVDVIKEAFKQKEEGA